MSSETDPVAPVTREASRKRSRFNFSRMFPDAVGWPVGWVVMQPDTILPAFVTHLGAGPLGVALIRAVYSLGIWLPSLWAARAACRWRNRGPYVVVVGLVERLPMLIIALAALWFAKDSPGLVLVVFYLCWSLRSLAEGINRPAYSQLLAESVRAVHRGRFWGYSTVACAAVAIPWSFWAAAKLRAMVFPNSYVFLFGVGFVVLVVTLLPLWGVRERIAGRVPAEDVPSGLRSLALLRGRPLFGYFTYATLASALADIAAPFYMVHALDKLQAPEHYAAIYSGVLTGAGAICALAVGAWVDRVGNKKALLCAGVLAMAAPLCVPLATTPATFCLVFALFGGGVTCINLYNYNMLLEVVPPQEAAAYCGAHYAVVEPARALAPVLGALIVRAFDTSAVFWPSVVLYGLWIVLIARMPEPRGQTASLRSSAN